MDCSKCTAPMRVVDVRPSGRSAPGRPPWPAWAPTLGAFTFRRHHCEACKEGVSTLELPADVVAELAGEDVAPPRAPKPKPKLRTKVRALRMLRNAHKPLATGALQTRLRVSKPTTLRVLRALVKENKVLCVEPSKSGTAEGYRGRTQAKWVAL